MKFAYLFLMLLTAHVVLAQDTPETQLNSLLSLDSLRTKRSLLTTAVYQGDTKLRPSTVVSLFKEDTLARRHYQWGRRLVPLGPLMAAAGVGVAYVGLKGRQETAEVIYYGQPIVATYTIRSRTQLIGGLALLAGGVCLVEFSNELIKRSVDRFKSLSSRPQSTTFRPSFQIGITPGGQVGLYARF